MVSTYFCSYRYRRLYSYFDTDDLIDHDHDHDHGHEYEEGNDHEHEHSPNHTSSHDSSGNETAEDVSHRHDSATVGLVEQKVCGAFTISTSF